ncbi:hypothetical protein [Tamlana crocina]|uniref:SprT-like domain-containing protein n=1 Tax=Tamlana crocina TaxID=393006 RepID=A0ABX1DE07_9FLAO|nr:hypothetical protein [Tamlana crocina]NJX16585.1 hypothetical protein [Tamlana crocina]
MKKQKLQNLLKFRILSFGILILFWNCQTEDYDQNSLNDIQEIKNTFSLDNFSDNNIKDNLIVHWNSFNSQKSSDKKSTLYQFNTDFKLNTKIENKNLKLFSTFKILASKNNTGAWNISLIKLVTNNKNDLEDVFYFSTNTFSGTISHYNLKGEPQKIEGYENGILVSEFFDTNKTLFSKRPLKTKNDGDNGSSNGGGGSFVLISVRNFTDWYKVYPDGTKEYTHTAYNGTTYEYIYVPSGSNYNTNYTKNTPQYYNSTPPTYNSNVDDKIDDTQLTGKAKCIYDKLTQSNSNLFKETIGQFIDDPKYNLTLTIGQCSTSDDACTNTVNLATTGEIIIKIEDNNTNPLQMAQYILHEAIHAELYRFVSRYESGIDPNNRPRLFQLFKYYSELYNIGDIQHIYMTEKYITPIASALRKLDGSKYPLDYYKAFAWDGLRVWDASNLLNVEMDSKYEDYRRIVIENTTISCD